MNADELLQRPETSLIVQNNQAFRDRFQRAAALLCSDGLDDDEAVRAFRKASEAIMGEVRVFISYKTEQASLAERFAGILGMLGGPKIDIYMAHTADGIPRGMRWLDDIDSQLKSSHWLFMLVPDPEQHRDWLIHEGDKFRDCMLKRIHRLICVHSPGLNPPDVFKEFQAVKARSDDIKSLLRQLFTRADAIPGMPPINRFLTNERLEYFSNEIDDLFTPKFKELYHVVPFIDLIIEDKDKYTGYESLMEAKVDKWENNEDTFGKFTKNCGTFGELVKVVEKEISQRSGCAFTVASKVWIEELSESIRIILKEKGQAPKPIQSLFSGVTEGKDFHPVLHSFACAERTPRALFHVSFIDEIPSTASGMPQELEALATAVRLSLKLQFELARQYLAEPVPPRRLETLDDIRTVERLLQRMESEAELRGTMNLGLMLKNFEGDDVSRVRDMFHYWEEEARPKIYEAIKNEKPEELKNALKAVAGKNLDFLELAFKRLSVLAKSW
jgi:hypothetical protein